MQLSDNNGDPQVIFAAPVQFNGVAAASLPTASTYDQHLLYVTDEELFAYSNGTDWLRLGLYNNGSSTQNGAAYTVDCGNQQQFIESIETDNTTSTWTISNMGEECLLYIYMTNALGKTLTITITGERVIDTDNKVAASAATASVTITIPGGVGYTHEILISKIGHTYSTDSIYHVSLK
jgi:hypothetical protein